MQFFGAISQRATLVAMAMALSSGGAYAAMCGFRPCAGPPPSTTPPVGSCQPANAVTVLVSGRNAVAYVPRGAWSNSQTGVAIANVEGSSVTNTLVPTTKVVNSCAANALTGKVVCTSNNPDVYLLTGTTLTTTLTSGGTGTVGFSGGNCTNCSVAIDGPHNRAAIALSIGGQKGFQILDLATNTFLSPFKAGSGDIAENPLIDPGRNLLLSPGENNKFEIVNLTTPSSPASFVNNMGGSGEADSAGEDCTTGLAFAPFEFTSNVFVADLSRATFTAGSPGTWTAPSQIQTLTESSLSAGFSGMAIAQGASVGLISGEFGGNTFTAISLPKAPLTSGKPAILDWVTCGIPGGFQMGLDPHTLTAYKSPNTGDGIALLSSGDATQLAVVDLTKMLNPAIVPRTPGGHACAAGTLSASTLTVLPLPTK